ncbi:MAG: hypothetical protein L6V87_10430 [Ruminococcus sp.]|nr:MAG: hypothetical protein L6V87_10430 [Ruminococcus sp.]
MITITVNASVKYDVIIGSGLLENCGKYVSSVTVAEKIALITDDNVDRIYSGTVEKSLKESGFDVRKFVFPSRRSLKNAPIHLIRYTASLPQTTLPVPTASQPLAAE